MTGQPTESLRERTRRAVQSELIDAAIGLFADRGYEAVTIDEIAAAAGLSKRSFFRYFPSKDEVVLGKIDRQGAQFAQALAERPDSETPWVALRRMFDGAVASTADEAGRAHADELDRIIYSSDALRAGYLQRMQKMQELVAAELNKRELRRRASTWAEVAAPALVAAAFAALIASHAHSRKEGISFEAALDEVMNAIAVETA